MRTLLVAALLIGLPLGSAVADPPPPPGAKPLTELLQGIEKSADFGYFDEVDWDNGVYEVEYYSKTGTKTKIYIDPVTGDKRS